MIVFSEYDDSPDKYFPVGTEGPDVSVDSHVSKDSDGEIISGRLGCQ